MSELYKPYLEKNPELWIDIRIKKPKKNSKVIGLVPNEIAAHYFKYVKGNFESYQRFNNRILINRWTVHYWCYETDFDKMK